MKRRKHCAEIRAGREAQVRDNMSELCSKYKNVRRQDGIPSAEGTLGLFYRIDHTFTHKKISITSGGLKSQSIFLY